MAGENQRDKQQSKNERREDRWFAKQPFCWFEPIFDAVKNCWYTRAGRAGPAAYLVLAYLNHWADWRTHICQASREQIMVGTGLSTKTARRAIKGLIHAQLIRPVRQSSPGRGDRNAYYIETLSKKGGQICPKRGSNMPQKGVKYAPKGGQICPTLEFIPSIELEELEKQRDERAGGGGLEPPPAARDEKDPNAVRAANKEYWRSMVEEFGGPPTTEQRRAARLDERMAIASKRFGAAAYWRRVPLAEAATEELFG